MRATATICAAFFAASLFGCGGTARTLTPPPVQRNAPAKIASCGAYRWQVKIAADPAAADIDTSPKGTTIAAMVALPAPVSPPADARANAVEKSVFRIANVAVANVHRELDRDVHLVIRDSTGRTMIVEDPDPSCATQSRFAAQIQNVRRALAARYGSDPNADPGTIVSVEGVGFFDYYHSQTGQARNAVELHPLTAICFGTSCSLP